MNNETEQKKIKQEIKKPKNWEEVESSTFFPFNKMNPWT